MCIRWIHCHNALETNPSLLLVLAALALSLLLRCRKVPRNSGFVLEHRNEFIQKWVLRRKHNIRSAKDSVWASSEDFDACFRKHRSGSRVSFCCRNNIERNLCTFAFSNPRTLCVLNVFLPWKCIEVIQEAFCILRNLHEPLCQALFFNFSAATFTFAVEHLLVCKHRVVFWAPLHGRLSTFRELVLKELRKKPLCPLVVFRVAGYDFLGPVYGRSH